MLKVNVGWSQERLAQQIAFGLAEGNLELLRSKGPIAIKGEEIGLEEAKSAELQAAGEWFDMPE